MKKMRKNEVEKVNLLLGNVLFPLCLSLISVGKFDESQNRQKIIGGTQSSILL
jgi:hypothetical protein